MSNNLPTEPGPYWWRKKEGDEWEIREIYKLGQSLVYYHDRCDWETVQEMGGQWAKAHKPDQGHEAFAVRAPAGQFVHIGPKEECESVAETMNETDMFLADQEYDVVPVTIYRKEKE